MIFKKICPRCGSEEVELIAGGVTGGYMCKRCGYTGGVIEKEIVGKKNEMKGENEGKDE